MTQSPALLPSSRFVQLLAARTKRLASCQGRDFANIINTGCHLIFCRKGVGRRLGQVSHLPKRLNCGEGRNWSMCIGRTIKLTHRMSAPDISDTTAHAVVVQCPCSAWWDAGWRRAHLKHITPIRSLTSEQFMKIVRREHRACVRAVNEPNDPTVPTEEGGEKL